jgi:hypothetical protein
MEASDMKSSLSLSSVHSRRRRLAACTAAIFAVSAAAPVTATVFVSICDDSGPGSLRAAVGAAGDPDTVDMTQLVCSPISLTTGAIDITQNDLTINGPGPSALLITGKNSPKPDRIFNHTGTGTLSITSVSMAYGDLINNSGDAAGGCIYSKGTVSLFYANVDSCSANSTTTFFGAARGGGIFTRGALVLKYGSLSNNSANGGVGGFAYGGGAVVYGNFTANLARISENYANGATDRLLGGGLLLKGNASIVASTISGNRSRKGVGGILQGYLASGYSSASLRIVNSTISGNSAAGIVGGIWSDAGTMQIYNSTIAFNTAGTETQGSLHEGPGLEAFALLDNVNLTLESSVLANNTYGNSAAEDDFTETNDLGKVTLTGHNNLIRVSSESLPSDTIVSACPLLGLLRNNGGQTPTHALLSSSPAIDKGNNNAVNPITTLPYPYDQRGAGFARVSGSFADIGAYEVQQDEIVFDAGLDGCP